MIIWDETKAVMDLIENELLMVDHVTLKEKHDQLVVLQNYINAQTAISIEMGRTRCFQGTKEIDAIYEKLRSNLIIARQGQK